MYIRTASLSPFALASANLLRRPCVNPMSKKEIQAIIELNVSQTPYWEGLI